VILKEGERLISHSTGGGGYGPPLLRDPELVLEDVEQGFVRADRARDVYGVVLHGTGAVDLTATARRRNELGRMQ
jgi:N-methylhydantoinase B/oxoprolinase/acetone carboxylase alpha subunit